jgi:hypothetical protein
MTHEALIATYCKLARSVADGYAQHSTHDAFLEANPEVDRPCLEIKLRSAQRLNVHGWRVIYHWPPLRAVDGDWFDCDTSADTVEQLIRARLIASERTRPAR